MTEAFARIRAHDYHPPQSDRRTVTVARAPLEHVLVHDREPIGRACAALADAAGRPWRLHDGLGRWRLLLWLFADWCPVCHREFAELLDARADLERLGVRLATLEAHDAGRGRLRVGREIEAALWGSRAWFREAYSERIWWPHLPDLAGTVGARYGTEPMTLAAHGEFVQRSTTVIVDPKRLAPRATGGAPRA